VKRKEERKRGYKEKMKERLNGKESRNRGGGGVGGKRVRWKEGGRGTGGEGRDEERRGMSEKQEEVTGCYVGAVVRCQGGELWWCESRRGEGKGEIKGEREG